MLKKITILMLISVSVLVLGLLGFAEVGQVGVGLSETEYTPSDFPIQPKLFTEVTLKDNLWEPRMKTNAEVSIPQVFQYKTGLGSSLTRGTLEAAIKSLQTYPDPEFQAVIDSYIQELKVAQEKNIGTRNSLFEPIVAYYNATGDRDLLDLFSKSADLLYNNALKDPPSGTGETNSLNFVQIYRATNDKRYLDMAKFYLDRRGLGYPGALGLYSQAHKPVLEQSEAVGHAVSCSSMLVSMVEVAALTGIEDYFDAANRIWEDIVGTKLYITGGIGSTFNQEGFEKPYMLPNACAYCESCAAIMFARFNHEMFLMTGDSKYIDVMERTMYNNCLDTVSASGTEFFYAHRLASAGIDDRNESYTTYCCPPRIVRFYSEMPSYIYAQNKDDIYVNLYISSDTSFNMVDTKKEISLSQESEMPWGGKTTIKVSAENGAKANIKLRIPGWARNQPVPGNLYQYLDKVEEQASISINGENVAYNIDKLGYVSLDRNWKDGDVIEIEFPFEVRKVVAHPNVEADRGKMSVERGPLVYCSEWPDYEDGIVLGALFDVESELKPSFDSEFYANNFAGLPYDDELYGGVTTISGEASSYNYFSFSEPKPIKLIPYYLWANRGLGEMTVWLSTTEEAVGRSLLPITPETIASKAKVTASEEGGHTTVGGKPTGEPDFLGYLALNDGLYPRSSESWKKMREYTPIIHFAPYITGQDWQWVQYEFDIIRKISGVEMCWHDGSPNNELYPPETYELVYKTSEEEDWKPVEIVSRSDEFVKDDYTPYWDSPETGAWTTYWASPGSMWSTAEFKPVEAKFLRLLMKRRTAKPEYIEHEGVPAVAGRWSAIVMLEWIVK